SSTPARTGAIRHTAQAVNDTAIASSLAPAYSANTEALGVSTAVAWPTAARNVPGAIRLTTPATALNKTPRITTAVTGARTSRSPSRELTRNVGKSPAAIIRDTPARKNNTTGVA